MSLLIRGGIDPDDERPLRLVDGDVSIRDGRIAAIGTDHRRSRTTASIDARGGYVLPGLIQTHIHLCQTLFRGYADDLPLMDWLRTRVWPMEAAHTPDTLRAAARLATTELLCERHDLGADDGDGARHGCRVRGGGGERLRATIGKCMMDFDAQVPQRLQETTQRVDRREPGDPQAVGRRGRRPAARRVRAALRGVVLARAARSGRRACRPSTHALVHTHASESRDEIAIVRQMSGGLTNLEYLAQPAPGVAAPVRGALRLGRRRASRQLLADHDVKVMHCPGSNLKLGSGIAPVPEMRARGITVSLGADGAACNNRLDMFEEMRLAAVLQAMRQQPGVLPARDVLWMATRAGARTLGLDDEIGSLEAGQARRPHRRRPRSAAPGAGARSRIRRWSTPRAAATSGRRSSTARCWSTTSRPCASIRPRWPSRPARRPRASWPRAPAFRCRLARGCARPCIMI